MFLGGGFLGGVGEKQKTFAQPGGDLPKVV